MSSSIFSREQVVFPLLAEGCPLAEGKVVTKTQWSSMLVIILFAECYSMWTAGFDQSLLVKLYWEIKAQAITDLKTSFFVINWEFRGRQTVVFTPSPKHMLFEVGLNSTQKPRGRLRFDYTLTLNPHQCGLVLTSCIFVTENHVKSTQS